MKAEEREAPVQAGWVRVCRREARRGHSQMQQASSTSPNGARGMMTHGSIQLVYSRAIKIYFRCFVKTIPISLQTCALPSAGLVPLTIFIQPSIYFSKHMPCNGRKEGANLLLNCFAICIQSHHCSPTSDTDHSW